MVSRLSAGDGNSLLSKKKTHKKPQDKNYKKRLIIGLVSPSVHQLIGYLLWVFSDPKVGENWFKDSRGNWCQCVLFFSI